jgi:hypothetical protein
MADVLETIDKGETIVILILIGVGVYVLYEASQEFSDWINNLFGLQGAAATGNTYSNAAGETLAHPINTLGTIGGGWFSDLFGSKDKTLPSELSSVGYVKVGASGQHWSCTGPQGADNDTCVPVSVDASGNMTATGPQIKASTAN